MYLGKATMNQLLEPDLTVKGEIGFCLKYAREMFGIPAKYSNAITAWNNSDKKSGHPPKHLAVPCWFSWGKDGHVVVQIPGRGYYSSPMNKGESKFIFSSITAVESFLGAKYLGWSTDINGIKVVGDGMLPYEELLYKYNESEKALRNREKEADLLKYKLSESEKALRNREKQAEGFVKEIADLRKALVNGDGFRQEDRETLNTIKKGLNL